MMRLGRTSFCVYFFCDVNTFLLIIKGVMSVCFDHLCESNSLHEFPSAWQDPWRLQPQAPLQCVKK